MHLVHDTTSEAELAVDQCTVLPRPPTPISTAAVDPKAASIDAASTGATDAAAPNTAEEPPLTLAEDGSAVQQITDAASASVTDWTAVGDGDILKAAAGAVDTVNGDTKDPTLIGNNLNAAADVVDTISQVDADTLTTALAVPAAGDLTQTAAENVAANAGSVGSGSLADLASSAGSPGVSASVGVIDESM